MYVTERSVPNFQNWYIWKQANDLTFLARDVIYTSRAYAMMSVSVCLSVTEVNWHIIVNLGFKSDPNLPRIVVTGRGHLNNNISRYASHC